MKTLPMIFAAALVAASPTLALAQADSATKPGTGLDADKNPSGLNANPAAGNPAGTDWVKQGKSAAKIKPMKTAPVSATHRAHAAKKIDAETSK
jgi:hypothetical protein